MYISEIHGLAIGLSMLSALQNEVDFYRITNVCELELNIFNRSQTRFC